MGIRINLDNKFLDRSTRSINEYIREIRNIPVLTKKEEQECAMLAYNGNKQAKEKLVLHNLKFVVSAAKQFTGEKIKISDLINEGNLGLIEAANEYDPKFGYKFLSYAMHFIRRRMLNFISENAQIVNIPPNKTTEISKLRNEIDKLNLSLGRNLSIDEILEIGIGELTASEIENLYLLSLIRVDSLDTLFRSDKGNGSNNQKLGDFIISDYYNIDDEFDTESTKKLIDYSLRDISLRHKLILTHLYGLNGERKKGIEEVASIYSLSKERVRQIEKSAIAALKNSLTDILKTEKV